MIYHRANTPYNGMVYHKVNERNKYLPVKIITPIIQDIQVIQATYYYLLYRIYSNNVKQKIKVNKKHIIFVKFIYKMIYFIVKSVDNYEKTMIVLSYNNNL